LTAPKSSVFLDRRSFAFFHGETTYDDHCSPISVRSVAPFDPKPRMKIANLNRSRQCRDASEKAVLPVFLCQVEH
jgi:hypothetical protein